MNAPEVNLKSAAPAATTLLEQWASYWIDGLQRFRQVERAAVEHVGSDLDTLRRTRDAAQEAAFVALYD